MKKIWILSGILLVTLIVLNGCASRKTGSEMETAGENALTVEQDTQPDNDADYTPATAPFGPEQQEADNPGGSAIQYEAGDESAGPVRFPEPFTLANDPDVYWLRADCVMPVNRALVGAGTSGRDERAVCQDYNRMHHAPVAW